MSGSPTIALRAGCADPLLDVMCFLNEIVAEHPEAISFGPGRPLDALVDLPGSVAAASTFVAEAARRTDRPRSRIWTELGQYGPTNGLIRDIVARHLAIDEQIVVEPDAVMITVGAQEAMAVLLAGLVEPRTDVLLVGDPTYVGITALARLHGIRVVSVPTGRDGLQPQAVEDAIRRASRLGRVRALYDVPDFNNPIGTSLSLADRVALLEVCHRHGVLVLEDNPYGMFAYDQPRRPTLKALDTHGDVLYVGSFAKTLLPGLRVGYLVADQRAADGERLAVALSRVKTLMTVNTPPLAQAIAAGLLLEHDGSLEPIVAPKRDRYREQRDTMLAALQSELGDLDDVAWNRPAGGFFVTVSVPFAFGPEEVRRCTGEYGVIVTPMQFFCVDVDRRREVRLAFSGVTPQEIVRGIGRFARFVRDTVGLRRPATYDGSCDETRLAATVPVLYAERRSIGNDGVRAAGHGGDAAKL